MKKIFGVWLLLCSIVLFAAPNFPPLSDRVVDHANLLYGDQKDALIDKLRTHEDETTNQIVVVVIQTLDGYDIADYGYQLGRHWSIGQSDKNNGVLLIVAMDEKKTRIEVGYGLEGVLPDALAHDIIQTKILPKFRQSKFYEGIDVGVDSIIAAIYGEYKQTKRCGTKQQNFDDSWLPFLFMGFMLLQIFVNRISKENKIKKIVGSLTVAGIVGIFSWLMFYVVALSILLTIIMFLITYFGKSDGSSYGYGSSSNSSGSFGGFGGGFSGGGGGFGGGGASGGW